MSNTTNNKRSILSGKHRMTSSEAFVETLVANDVTDVFGIVGSAFMDALDLFPASGIRFIPTVHEQGSAHMADGYARVSGRHGVCIAQNGPGITNFVTAVGAAYWAHSPVVVVTPETGTMSVGLGGFQETEQLPIFSKITKYQGHVNNPRRIAEITGRCFDRALLEMGPSQLNIPRDYFYGDFEFEIPQPIRIERGAGGVLLDEDEKSRLQTLMWTNGKLNPEVTAHSAQQIATRAGLNLENFEKIKFLMVEESGTGSSYPFSGEKLAPVLTVYRAKDFDHACSIVDAIYAYQGAGHSVSIHSHNNEHISRLGLELPVCRVIVNQAHCFATGGNFDNGLPFSLSMGCGTWGGNNFSDNLNYRHYLNITRIVRKIPERIPTEQEIFGAYLHKFG